MKYAFLAFTLVAAAACATGRYVHPTKSAADLAVDDAECQQEAARLYPPLYKQGEVLDQNQTSRYAGTQSCLRTRGWKWQTDPQ